MQTSATLVDQLRDRSGQYFADLHADRAQVSLRRVRRRGNSTLQEFVLGDDTARHVILVKTPSVGPCRVRTTNQGRPRMFPQTSPEVKGRLEYQAMSAIERYVERLGDPRFGAVRVLDLLSDQQAIVMEKVGEQSLNTLILKGATVSRTEGTRRLLGRVIRNSGSWLRYYHALPGLEHTKVRGASRAAFVDSIQLCSEYLSEFHRCPYFERQGRELIHLAEEMLPSQLPLGLGHGDYAPRNVLMASTGKIRVIDTLSRWVAPVYEDIACFLTSLKASGPQIWSWGLAYRRPSVAYLEGQFLDGYFGDQQVPISQIKLFECQCLLERWSASADRFQSLPTWRRCMAGVSRRWCDVFMCSQLRQLIDGMRDPHACLTWMIEK